MASHCLLNQVQDRSQSQNSGPTCLLSGQCLADWAHLTNEDPIPLRRPSSDLVSIRFFLVSRLGWTDALLVA